MNPTDLITRDVLASARRQAKVCSERTGGAVDADELFSVAQTAIVEAAGRFDSASGVPFGAYAYKRVRGAMQDYLRSIDPTSRTVRDAVRGLRNKPESELTTEDRLNLGRVCSVVYTDAQPEGFLDSVVSGEGGTDETTQRDPGKVLPALLELDEQSQFVLWQTLVHEHRDVDVAAFLGVSGARVSQIREDACKRLRFFFQRAEAVQEST